MSEIADVQDVQDAQTWAEGEQGAKVDAARLQVKALECSELTGLWQSNWEAAHQLKTKVGGALEARKLDDVSLLWGGSI